MGGGQKGPFGPHPRMKYSIRRENTLAEFQLFLQFEYSLQDEGREICYYKIIQSEIAFSVGNHYILLCEIGLQVIKTQIQKFQISRVLISGIVDFFSQLLKS